MIFVFWNFRTIRTVLALDIPYVGNEDSVRRACSVELVRSISLRVEYTTSAPTSVVNLASPHTPISNKGRGSHS